MTTSVSLYRIKARELFQSNFTPKFLAFTIVWFFFKLVIQVYMGRCWKVWTLSALKISTRTLFPVTLKTKFCSLLSTIFTRNFLVAIEGRFWSNNGLTGKSDMSLKIVAFWLQQGKGKNGKNLLQVLIKTLYLKWKGHRRNEQPRKEIPTTKKSPTNQTTSFQLLSFILKTDCTFSNY